MGESENPEECKKKESCRLLNTKIWNILLSNYGINGDIYMYKRNLSDKNSAKCGFLVHKQYYRY